MDALFNDPDWEWIDRFKKGDVSAFNQIFHKYKHVVVNLAFRFVRQREAAEDIAQAVFIKVYEKKVNFDPKAKFSTWLYRVTYNASLDFIRRKKFSFKSLDEEEQNATGDKRTLLEKYPDPKSVSPVESVLREELCLLVQKEIDKLPEKLRVPILLYQFEKLPYSEIARILGLTEKAVERRLYHAKETLRKKLSLIM